MHVDDFLSPPSTAVEAHERVTTRYDDDEDVVFLLHPHAVPLKE